MAVVHALRAAGHDVVAVRDLAPGAPDGIVAEHALSDGRILLTEDKDLGQFAHAAAKTPGVILMRYTATARQAVAAEVVKLLGDHGSEVSGRFVIVEPGRVRIGRAR
jgi:predicted nuclease of predicted toxin-antitoxin system